MKLFSLICTVLMLSACSLPKTIAELETIDRKETFCNSDNLKITKDKIYKRLAYCYNRTSSIPVVVNNSSMKGTLTTIRSNNKVVEKRSAKDEPIYYVVSDGYFGFRLSLESGDPDTCPTIVTTKTMNFAWDRHADRIKTWLEDPKAGCQAW